jgi:ElaB/YqjD/DUF883 family membrane-anchored ribosome-binding protein
MDHRRLRAKPLSDLVPPAAEGIPELDWAHTQVGPTELYERFPSEIAGATVQRLQQVREIEPTATAAITNAMAEAGARPHGLPFRMKSPESTARKIDAKVMKTTAPAEDVANRLTDLLRYTALSDTTDQITSAARSTTDRLVEQGWAVVQAEHTYVDGNPYKGLHVLLRPPGANLVIELQFHSDHTQASRTSPTPTTNWNEMPFSHARSGRQRMPAWLRSGRRSPRRPASIS